MSHPAPVKPGSLVLVTGINGNIGTFLALDLLRKGYRVRGTVRALSRVKYTKNTFASFGNKAELVEVPDLAKPGAFAVALEGVDAIYHTASPVSISAKRAEEQYVPAVDGTLSLLRSAANTPSVKRFIYLGTTGSVIMGEKDASKEILTRDDWNTSSEPALKDPDSPYNAFNIYCGSKIAAERSSFEFATTNKPSFSVTSVLPSMIVGPIVKELTAPPPRDDPGVAIGQQYNTFANPSRVDGISPIVSVVWVHIQDVADLFSAALTSNKTAGVRLLAHAGRFSWEQFANAVRKEFPDRPFPPVKADAPTMMFPGATEVQFDTALEEELLGGKWRSFNDAALSAARDLIKKEKNGWDKAA